jgi:hypothetical protein
VFLSKTKTHIPSRVSHLSNDPPNPGIGSRVPIGCCLSFPAPRSRGITIDRHWRKPLPATNLLVTTLLCKTFKTFPSVAYSSDLVNRRIQSSVTWKLTSYTCCSDWKHPSNGFPIRDAPQAVGAPESRSYQYGSIHERCESKEKIEAQGK